MRVRAAVLAVALGVLVPPATARADAEPQGPSPSVPQYGIRAPREDPARQEHVVRAADGTELFIETWLPVRAGGQRPPKRVPVIVSISPYLGDGRPESREVLETMVPRGYAYSNVHVRGTGRSGGCLDLFGPTEADDSARAVEFLGRNAPFSSGAVGGWGVSYPGGTVLSVAGRGDPHRTRYLRTVVAGAPFHSMHEAQWTFDGVPSLGVSALTASFYGTRSLGAAVEDGGVRVPPLRRIPERPGCVPGHVLAGADTSGDHTPWHRARDNRAWTHRIRVPTFVFHGHHDLVPAGGSPPSTQVGLFDALPPTIQKFGMFGQFGHQRPPGPDYQRRLVQWFDHWLRGVDNGVDSWPTALVQATDGRWSVARDWPVAGGPAAELRLGPGGLLGARRAEGSTSYVELGLETSGGSLPGSSATFQSPPLARGLELIGQPVLDLWASLSLPDAHVAARLEALDAAGVPVPHGATYGVRSARHLEPLRDGRFVQERGRPAPVDRPVLIPVRFQPTAIVVPPGGRLRLTVAGSLIVNEGLAQLGVPEPLVLGPSLPSGLPTRVTILHDDRHPSRLRFHRR